MKCYFTIPHKTKGSPSNHIEQDCQSNWMKKIRFMNKRIEYLFLQVLNIIWSHKLCYQCEQVSFCFFGLIEVLTTNLLSQIVGIQKPSDMTKPKSLITIMRIVVSINKLMVTSVRTYPINWITLKNANAKFQNRKRYTVMKLSKQKKR